MSHPQPSDEEAAAGCLGWLVGCAVALVAIIVLAIEGFDFPAGLPDVYSDFWSAGYRQNTGEAVVLVFAFMAVMTAALAAGWFVDWLAERIRVGQAHADLLAEASAAVVTVVYVVALGLAGDSWAVLAASTFLGLLVFFVARSALNRLRR